MKTRKFIQIPVEGTGVGLKKKIYHQFKVMCLSSEIRVYEAVAMLIRIAVAHQDWFKGIVEEHKRSVEDKK